MNDSLFCLAFPGVDSAAFQSVDFRDEDGEEVRGQGEREGVREEVRMMRRGKPSSLGSAGGSILQDRYHALFRG